MPRKYDPNRLTKHQAAYLLAAYGGTDPVEAAEDVQAQIHRQRSADVLRRRGFVDADEVTLTPAGRELAEALRRDTGGQP